MSIKVGSKVRTKRNAYGFRAGMVGEVTDAYPGDRFADGMWLYVVSFAESGYPDPGTTTGWAMLSTEVEEV